jgi:hypothetical protein
MSPSKGKIKKHELEILQHCIRTSQYICTMDGIRNKPTISDMKLVISVPLSIRKNMLRVS